MSEGEERSGIWTHLPGTVSTAARQIAEFMRKMPPPALDAAITLDQRKQGIEAMAAWMNSPAGEQACNVYPANVSCRDIDGAQHTVFAPVGSSGAHANSLIIDLHGGAYISGSPALERPCATPLVAALGCTVLAVRYPLWWEAPPPADVDRVVAVYRAMLAEYEAPRIALMGTSAGGGLALRSALKLKALGLPQPAALILNTPWSDLGGAGDSFRTLMSYDMLEAVIVDMVRPLKGSYAALEDPALSPVYADDFRGLAPTQLLSGTRDSLLSDCARLQRKLTEAQVVNELRVFEGMWHGFNTWRMPESDAWAGDVTAFLRRHLCAG